MAKKHYPILLILSLVSLSGFLIYTGIFPEEAPDDGYVTGFPEEAPDAVYVTGSPESAAYQEWITTRDPQTGTIPFQRLWAAKAYAESLRNSDGTSPSDIEWEERGPSNVGGRTRAILFDPNDPSHKKVWAGSVSGGLWVTNDITADPPLWNKVDDFWERLPVGCMAYDPTDKDVFYVGTGEPYYTYGTRMGAGIYKSTDGGATWDTITSTFFTSNFNRVNDIAVHPVTGDVYASTMGSNNNFGGLFRSSNGGATWTVVLNKNTAPTSSPSNIGADIEIASDNTIYVTMGARESGGIYKSLTGDPGDWTEITTGIDIQATRRIELAISPSSPNILYCAAEDTTSNIDIQGMYRSTNGGNSWTAISIPMRDATKSFAKGQAWYDLTLAVHPTNPNLVYAGGVKLFRSTDGGSTWTKVEEIHDDLHVIISRPGFNDQMLFGTDGGVYFTTDCTAETPDIQDKNNSYNVTQFYTVAYHPDIHIEYFLGGTQDNGTPRFESPGINATTEANNGDGAYCYISQSNPRYQITARQWNRYYRSMDYGATFQKMEAEIKKNWLIPPAVYDEEEDFLYASYNEDSLLRVKNFFGDFEYEYIDTLALGGVPSAFHIYPFASNCIVFGTSTGRLFRLENASSENDWFLYEYNTTPLPMGNISSIDFGANSQQILLTFSNYGVTSVWESTNNGGSWTNLEGNLPDMPVRCGIYNPYDYKQVILGTEVGVWATEDITVPNPFWLPGNGGLANVEVKQLALRRSDMKIYAATFGRGIFTSNSFNAIPAQKVIAGDGSDTSYLGCSVSLHGNYAIAGAYGDHDYRGAAYVYKFNGNTWEQSAKLTAINGLPGDRFGVKVTTDGEYAVIGAVHDDHLASDAGAAYVFQRSGETWTQKAKLTDLFGEINAHFGGSVAIDGEYIAVGAPADTALGSVSIFKGSGSSWVQMKKITPEAGSEINFGAALSLRNDTLVVGSPGMLGDKGNLSIYVRNGEDWVYYWDYGPSVAQSRMGFDVAFMNNWYIAGAPMLDNTAADQSGGAYIIHRTPGGASINTGLFPPDSWYYYETGSSLDLLDDYIIIGSPVDGNIVSGGGSVSIFKRQNFLWQFFLKLFPDDLGRNDYFGSDVALSAQYVIVGSPHDDNENGVNAGSVYFFRNYASGLSQPDLSVVPLHRDIPATQCQASFNVYNLGTGTMDWTATANDAWITITGGASGDDDGTIQLSFTQNNYCSRTGTITVAAPGALHSPKLIEITQTAVGSEDEVKILPNDLVKYDYFGYSVAIDGAVAVIGCYGDDDKGSSAGSAYIYQYNGIAWIQTRKFYPNDPSAGDLFGSDVSISGDYILVGANGKDSGKGAAYLFRKGAAGWANISQAAKFQASDAIAGTNFGQRLDISGDYAIVAAPGTEQTRGAVYFFDQPAEGWSNTTETVKLIGDDVETGDYFACDVAISGVYAVVGSHHDNGKGSAYLFRRAWVWREDCKLTSSDGASGDQFGYSVDIWGENVIAGANRDDAGKGAAYLFQRPSSGWASMTETRKMVADDRAEDDFFGESVAVHEHNALVGSLNDDEKGINSGSAYGFIFNDTTSWLEEKILASDGLSSDHFGRSVGITYQYSIIGASDRSESGTSSGKAYIFCNSCLTVCTPELAVDPSGTVNLPQEGGTGQLSVSNTGTCALSWRCRSNASWLTITGDSTGTGSGTIHYSWTTNPGNARSTELIFTSPEAFNTPVTLTVNQAQGPDIVLDSDTIGDGQTLCLFATNTITVPQTGGAYLIEANAEVTIKAGTAIHFLPGFLAEPGSTLHAFISSTPCTTPPATADQDPPEELTWIPEEITGQTPAKEFMVFPNPADDQVNLLFNEQISGERIFVEVYNLMGELQLTQEKPFNRLTTITVNTLPAGICLVRVRIDTGEWRSEKLIIL